MDPELDAAIAEVEAANAGQPDTMQPADPNAKADPAPAEDDVNDEGGDSADLDDEGDADGDDSGVNDKGGDGDSGEDDDDDGGDEEGGKKARSKSAKDRIAQLTAEKHEERRQREALEARLAALEAKDKPKEPEPGADLVEPKEPDPADFEYGETDPAFIDARQDYKLDLRDYNRAKADAEVQKADAKARQVDEARNAQMQALRAGVDRAEAEGRKKYDDFDAKIAEGAKAGALPPIVTVGVAVSSVGHDLAYRFATDADARAKVEAAKGNPNNTALALGELEAEYTDDDSDLDMSDNLDMARALGRMRARVAGKSAKPAEPVIKPTDAPEPPARRAKGGGGGAGVRPDTDNIDDFYNTYGHEIGV